MSEYEYDGEEFAADPWEPWNAALEANPAAAQWELAQHAAAQATQQNAVDPNAIAADVLARAHEMQMLQQQNETADFEARQLDRSLSAAYGEDWVRRSGEVAHRLATDEALQKEWEKARDSQERLELLDREYQAVKSQPSKVFKEIMDAPSGRLGL